MPYHFDDDEARDGETVRTPLFLMDHVSPQFAFDAALHHPGYRTPATDAKVEDARSAAREARDACIKRTSEAWRTAGRDAEPDDPPDPPALMPRPDDPSSVDAAQRRRDKAYQAHREPLANAWKTVGLFTGVGPGVAGPAAGRVGPGPPK